MGEKLLKNIINKRSINKSKQQAKYSKFHETIIREMRERLLKEKLGIRNKKFKKII